MKRLLFWLIVGVIVVGAGTAAYSYFYASRSGDVSSKYRTMEVRRGDIVFSVPSTGTVQPVQSVQVGSFVSGPVQTVYVDFNAKVKKKQLLAKVDPLLFNAQHSQAQASLDCANANLLQAEAKLRQATRDWKRAESTPTASTRRSATESSNTLPTGIAALRKRWMSGQDRTHPPLPPNDGDTLSTYPCYRLGF